MATIEAIAQLIADSISEYAQVSITDKGNTLEIKDRTGTTSLPIRTSRTTSKSSTTFR